MQCKDCTHATVCMHTSEFDRLEGLLPVTGYPFKSAVTCGCYKQEQPQARNGFYESIATSKAMNGERT